MAPFRFDVACFGARIRVSVPGELAAPVLDALPPGADGDAVGPADATLCVEPIEGSSGRWRLVEDDVEITTANSPAELAAELASRVHVLVANHARDVLFVHAGVVEWRGLAVVIPGRSGTGKSTLVRALVDAGATYYSDEYAVFDDCGFVHPYLKPLSPRGLPQVPVADLGRVGRRPVPVGLVVSTRYAPGAMWRPIPLAGARATLPVIDNTVLARQEHRRTLAVAALIAGESRILSGPRPEAAEVATALLAEVDRLADEAGIGSAPGGAFYPARYLVLDDFLDVDAHRRVVEFMLEHGEEFESSAVREVGAAEGGVSKAIRASHTTSELDEIWPLFDDRLRRLLPGIRRELGVGWFALSQIERQLTVHRDGGFFAQHTDTGEHFRSRRITFVYYFNSQPRRFSGGELRISDAVLRSDGYLHAADTWVDLAPADNTIVFFPSATHHEVLSVSAPDDDLRSARFTVHGWFHTADID